MTTSTQASALLLLSGAEFSSHFYSPRGLENESELTLIEMEKTKVRNRERLQEQHLILIRFVELLLKVGFFLSNDIFLFLGNGTKANFDLGTKTKPI